MLYLFHGPDEYSIQQAVVALKAQLGDADLVTLNTTVLDGRRTSLAEVVAAADALPFLAEHRLVIVERLLAQVVGNKEASEQLAAYLARVPASTVLVLIEDKLDRRASITRHILQLPKEQAQVRAFAMMDQRALVDWVRQQVSQGAGRIDGAAASLLAELVGTDLRLLGQEIAKLLDYVGGMRPITRADVQALCSYTPNARVFDMVDALGQRDGQTALSLLHRLLDEGQAELYLLSMITRQFRILVSIKDLEQRRASAGDMGARLGMPPFVVNKGRQQARNFDAAHLARIYRQLVDIDTATKTGQMDPALALDLFVVDVCRR
ncbi:MAG: DNA polymerase III subunit delta [Chloroflexi bacterium]|nr:DNA polymerase III subunit delta [Chloroflexota bacterium]MBU1752072.1 DNA polymerase III subunit delta [Chloroflexota bacterium]